MKYKKQIKEYFTIIYLKQNKSIFKSKFNICSNIIKITFSHLNHNAWLKLDLSIKKNINLIKFKGKFLVEETC